MEVLFCYCSIKVKNILFFRNFQSILTFIYFLLSLSYNSTSDSLNCIHGNRHTLENFWNVHLILKIVTTTNQMCVTYLKLETVPWYVIHNNGNIKHRKLTHKVI